MLGMIENRKDVEKRVFGLYQKARLGQIEVTKDLFIDTMKDLLDYLGCYGDDFKNLTLGEKLYCFLSELAILTNLYELEVGGCGCCGSPYITNLKTGEIVSEYLTYNEKREDYRLDESMTEITRKHTQKQIDELNREIRYIKSKMPIIEEIEKEKSVDKIFKGLEEMQKRFEEREKDKNDN